MNIQWPPVNLGWIIALVVLILCIVLAVVQPASRSIELMLIALLALARLV